MSFENNLAKFKALIAIANEQKKKEDPNFTHYEYLIEPPSEAYPDGHLFFNPDSSKENKSIVALIWEEALEG